MRRARMARPPMELVDAFRSSVLARARRLVVVRARGAGGVGVQVPWCGRPRRLPGSPLRGVAAAGGSRDRRCAADGVVARLRRCIETARSSLSARPARVQARRRSRGAFVVAMPCRERRSVLSPRVLPEVAGPARFHDCAPRWRQEARGRYGRAAAALGGVSADGGGARPQRQGARRARVDLRAQPRAGPLPKAVNAVACRRDRRSAFRTRAAEPPCRFRQEGARLVMQSCGMGTARTCGGAIPSGRVLPDRRARGQRTRPRGCDTL